MTMQQFLTMTLSTAKSVTTARGIRRAFAGIFAVAIALIAAASPAAAQVFDGKLIVVDDDGDGVGTTGKTLREALAEAEASPTNDIIKFDDSVSEIHLTQDELWIGFMVMPPDSGALMIDGRINGGLDRVRIDAGGQSGVLVVGSEFAWLKGLELVNGNASLGGGLMVWDPATVLLEDSWIHDNYASQGGGIYSIGVLTINDTTVENNISGDVGGGVYFYGGYEGILDATNLTLSHNDARSAGGGLFNDQAVEVVTLTDPIIWDNTARNGGGIYNYLGPLSLIGGEFSGNQADRKGNDVYYTAGSIDPNDLIGLDVYEEKPKRGRR